MNTVKCLFGQVTWQPKQLTEFRDTHSEVNREFSSLISFIKRPVRNRRKGMQFLIIKFILGKIAAHNLVAKPYILIPVLVSLIRHSAHVVIGLIDMNNVFNLC